MATTERGIPELMRTESMRTVLMRLPDELTDSSLFLVKRLGLAAKELTHDAYERLGLNPHHHAILATIAAGPPDTQGAIAETLGYDKGQLVGLLDELEDQSLVERQRDPNDRRRQLVRITPEGRKTLAKVRTLQARVEDEFLARLTDSEREQLHALLLRLAEEHLPNCGAPIPRG